MPEPPATVAFCAENIPFSMTSAMLKVPVSKARMNRARRIAPSRVMLLWQVYQRHYKTKDGSY